MIPGPPPFGRPAQPATVLVPVERNPDGPVIHINVQTAEQMDPALVNSGMFQRVAFAQLSLRERLAPASSSVPGMPGAVPPPPPPPPPLQSASGHRGFPPQQFPTATPIGGLHGGAYYPGPNAAAAAAAAAPSRYVPSAPVAIPARAMPATAAAAHAYAPSEYPQASSPTLSDDFRMNLPSTDNSDIEIDEAMFDGDCDWMGGDDSIPDIDVPCCTATYQWAADGCSTLGQRMDAGCFGPGWGHASSSSSTKAPLVQPSHKKQKSETKGFFSSLNKAVGNRICGPPQVDNTFPPQQPPPQGAQREFVTAKGSNFGGRSSQFVKRA